MFRFTKNRHVTLVMALLMGLILTFTSIARPLEASADGRRTVDISDPIGGGGDSGDPDIPTGPSKGTNNGAQSVSGSVLDITAGGDGGRKSIMMWRLAVAMQVFWIAIRR